jgi:hypothetical protein
VCLGDQRAPSGRRRSVMHARLMHGSVHGARSSQCVRAWGAVPFGYLAVL